MGHRRRAPRDLSRQSHWTCHESRYGAAVDLGREEGTPSSRRTAAALVSAEADGTIVVRFNAACHLTKPLAEEVVAAHFELCRGRRHRVLADVRGMLSVDRGARELANESPAGQLTARMAILVGNALSRTIGNFFLKVTTPHYPTKIFTDEAQARVWLKEH